jgi:hypothetical protein
LSENTKWRIFIHAQAHNLTGGHEHPDQNHFIISRGSDMLAVDDGYSYKKATRNHNTILIGNAGQWGEGTL